MRWTLKADWLFIIPATVVWLVALSIIIWDFVALQRATFHFGLAFITGAMLIIIGVAIRAQSRRALGKGFSYMLRVRPDHHLITEGIYKHIRHPAYVGDLLFHFGVALLFSSCWGLLAMFGLIPCLLYRITIEEKMLTEKFGETYRTYMKSSKKLIPRIY